MKHIPGKLTLDFDVEAGANGCMRLVSKDLEHFGIVLERGQLSNMLALLTPALEVRLLLMDDVRISKSLISIQTMDDVPLSPTDTSWHTRSKLRCVITPA